MDYGPSSLGAAFSLLLMLVLTMKWKLPKMPALLGIAATTLAAAALFLCVYPLCGTGWGVAACVLTQTATALILALALMMLRFWRDPDRVPPETEGAVLSAADGEVLYVWTVDDGATPLVTKRGKDYLLTELMGTSLVASAAHVIGVEMTFLDVHVSRCPIAGQVRLLKHIPGKFLSLRKEEALFANERHTTIIENAFLVLAVVQVASRLVRRVESYLSVDQAVGAGQRLGMIRFGSLVAVVLPK